MKLLQINPTCTRGFKIYFDNFPNNEVSMSENSCLIEATMWFVCVLRKGSLDIKDESMDKLMY